MADKSVMAAVKGGPVKSTYAKNLRITSTGDYFNGVMVMGNSKYTLWGPKTQLHRKRS